MKDFAHHLSTLLDDVAAGIDPQPNFEAVTAARVPVVPNAGGAGRRFHYVLGSAAASVVLVAGGVAAYHVAGDGDPTAVLTSDAIDRQPAADADPLPKPEPDPKVVVPWSDGEIRRPEQDRPTEPKHVDAHRAAEIAGLDVVGDRLAVRVVGAAAPGEPVAVASEHGATAVGVAKEGSFSVTAKLAGLSAGDEAVVRVTFGWSDHVVELPVVHPGATEPEQPHEIAAPEPEATTTIAEPEQEPEPPKPTAPPTTKAPEPKREEPKPTTPTTTVAPIAFTSHLGDSYQDEWWMKQVFFGTAPPGTHIIARSEWGSADTVVGEKGHWDLKLKLAEVPDGTVVHVEVRSSSGSSHHYELVRDRPEPEPKPFSSELGGSHLDANPMKQGFWGTGTPGSVVIASSEYGSADAVVEHNGHWEMWLKMYEVPAGTVVHVQVTNNASEAVYHYELQRPHEPEQPAFTAHAVYETCDSNPPYNDYWGTAPAGAVISITSPYGGAELTANQHGEWEKRVEFPEAPYGVWFDVHVSSGGVTKTFPFKRVEHGG